MTDESALRALATLGTLQSDAALQINQADLRSLLQPYADHGREVRVLLALGTNGLRRQLGYVPRRTDATALSCPVDERRVVGQRALRHLLVMLHGQYQPFLHEWLLRVHERRLRVPDEMVPLLLDVGNARHDVRVIILALIGERGVWLMQQASRHEWHWAMLDFDVENPFQTYIPEQMWRLRHRDPEQARIWLMRLWDKMPQEYRADGLELLFGNLSLADVPFIERHLNDKDTRRIAARMLLQLPESRFAQDLIGDLEGVFVLERTGHRDLWTIDFRWSRYHRNRSKTITQRSDHLRRWYDYFGTSITVEDMLTYVPPREWCRRLGTTPEGLIQAAHNSTESTKFLTAWARSAYNARDGDFAFRLLRTVRYNDLEPQLLRSMLATLNVEQLETLAHAWLTELPVRFWLGHPALWALRSHRLHKQTYSLPLTQAVLGALRHSFADVARPLLKREIRDPLSAMVPYFHIRKRAELEQVLHTSARADMSEAELEIIQDMLEHLDFRARMLHAIDHTPD